MRRSLPIAGLLATLLLLMTPSPAVAVVDGACAGTLAGSDVAAGHDTRADAIRVRPDQTVTYEGTSTDGRDVSRVTLDASVAGIRLSLLDLATSGPSWSGRADLEQYTRAGIGLYEIDGVALSSDGSVVCTVRLFLCVEGSPFTTVAGGAAAAAGLAGLVILLTGLVRARRVRGGALGAVAGGIALGAAVAVLAQQGCLLPLTRTSALADMAAGGVVGLLLARVLRPRGRRLERAHAGLVLPAPVVVPAPDPGPGPQPAAVAAPAALPAAAAADRPAKGRRRRRRRRTHRRIYQFSPAGGSCRACRGHATHRVYRSARGIALDRAHPGCGCGVGFHRVDRGTYAAYFPRGRSVYDDRGA